MVQRLFEKMTFFLVDPPLKEDMVTPSGKAALITRYNETKHHLSPRCSPNNLEVKEEEETEREGEEREEREGGEESIVLEETAGLVFGDDNSYGK